MAAPWSLQLLPCGFHGPRERELQVEMVAAKGPPRSWHMWLGTMPSYAIHAIAMRLDIFGIS